jgi:hypothetical protein
VPRKRDYPKILIVEGADDRHSVIGLMRHHIAWPEESERWPVWIEVGNSVDEVLAPAYLTTEIKSSNARIVGVVLDSDLTAAGPLSAGPATLLKSVPKYALHNARGRTRCA